MSIRSGTGTLQVHEIFIKASPQMIWEAITTPEQSSQYGSRGLVTVDSSPGGEFRERATGDMLLRGSPEVIADGQVIECRPPRKLIHTYRRLTTDGHTAEGFSRLTWEIGSSPSGCSRVVVTHDLEDAPLLMASLSSNPQHEGGWSWILSDLKTFLETGGTMATSWSDFRNAPREERRSFVPIHRDRRTAVLAGIAAMHVLAIYLIANASFGPRSRELTLLETRFIPNAKPEQPPPPTFSDAMVTQSEPIWIPAPETAILVPADEPATALRQVVVAQSGGNNEPAPEVQNLEGFKRPRPISRPPIRERYPRESLVAKETGTSTVKICISARGTVESVELAATSGFVRLDNAAVQLSKAYRFAPATRDGEPVPVCLPYKINFRID